MITVLTYSGEKHEFESATGWDIDMNDYTLHVMDDFVTLRSYAYGEWLYPARVGTYEDFMRELSPA